MSTTTITALPTANGIDGAIDWLAIDRTSLGVTQKINRQTLLGVTGQPMDINTIQTVSNKILDNTNTITVRDGVFTLQDDVDLTKQARFQLSGISTATTRTYTLPNASSTLMDISSVQTATNKTFTSPVITGGTIDNSTITVDAISGHTTPNSGTIYGLTITSGKVGTNGVITASITNNAVDSTKVATGFAIQQANAVFTAVATGTTVVPVDNTIPQNTEGDQYMTVSITPKATTNILIVQIVAFVATHTINNAVIALFQDSTANALAAGMTRVTSADGPVMLVMQHTMVTGTTSATTFKVRIGPQGADTLTFNGSAGASLFGAITKSSIIITEYKV